MSDSNEKLSEQEQELRRRNISGGDSQNNSINNDNSTHSNVNKTNSDDSDRDNLLDNDAVDSDHVSKNISLLIFGENF